MTTDIIKTPTNQGKTIILTALMIILIGAATSVFIANFDTQTIDNDPAKLTRENLNLIKNKIISYKEQIGNLPCPAPLTTPIDSEQFGRTVDCSFIGDLNNTLRNTNGRDGRAIRIGTIPVRTLNLPDRLIADEYGHRYIYAVTEQLAINSTLYNPNEAGIFVHDAEHTPLTSPSGSTEFVILSTGQNGKGSISMDGIHNNSTCTNEPDYAGTPPNTETENCDLDETYIYDAQLTFIQTNPDTPILFDDHVIYE